MNDISNCVEGRNHCMKAFLNYPKLFCCFIWIVVFSIFLFPSVLIAHMLKGDPTAIDELLFHSGKKFWQTGSNSETEIVKLKDNDVIILKKQSNGIYPLKGYYESPEYKIDFLFTEILPSWNFDLPEKTGYAVQIAIKKEDSDWSKWYYLGGNEPKEKYPFDKIAEDDYAKVDVDYLITKEPVKYIKYKIWLFSNDGKNTPALVRFFLALRGSQKINPNYVQPKEEIKKDLPKKIKMRVPFRSQIVLREELRGQACCPTSVSMVLAHYKNKIETEKVCELCYDPIEEMYGIWPRASQTLSQFELVSYVRRYRNFDEVRETLAKKIPIIISIKTNRGDLPEVPSNAPGHIIVITGYKGKDIFYINNPGTHHHKKGHKVKYSPERLQKVWLDNGGVGILAYPEDKKM